MLGKYIKIIYLTYVIGTVNNIVLTLLGLKNRSKHDPKCNYTGLELRLAGKMSCSKHFKYVSAHNLL